MNEPILPRVPRPCSVPHSAPSAWLRSDEAGRAPLSDDPPTSTPLPLAEVAAHLRANPDDLADFIASLAPEGTRGDGWTPFARKLFLQVIAETGRVGLALRYCGLSKQSANALRNRDPLFAAGWDAASLIARGPLADEILEKGLDGVTETVTRNGEVVAERHRYDSRLSIAVLHRLDKRCDRAEEQGGAHLAAMRRWADYLDCIGKDDSDAARAILTAPPHGQFGQLPQSETPIEGDTPPGCDPSDNVWQDADGRWLTCFPPPPGFDGYEKGSPRGFDHYERACTPEEVAALEGSIVAEDEEMLAEQEQARDAYFASLRAAAAAIRPQARATGAAAPKPAGPRTRRKRPRTALRSPAK